MISPLRVGAEPARVAAVRAPILLLAIAIGSVVAWAEPTTTAVVVRRKPNAKARAVIALPVATEVTITGAAGTWIAIKARLGKRAVVGYIPRAAIVPPSPGEVEEAEDSFTAAPTAEPRTTIESVVVRARPGEKQAALATLPAQTAVTVLAERGRWMRIRSGAITGYVTRTTITGPPPATEIVAPAPVVVTPAVPGWGDAHRDRASSALVVYATTAARLRADADAASPIVAAVTTGDVLEVLDGRGATGWVKVRDAHAHVGWVARAEVGNGAAQAAIDVPVARPTTARTRDATLATPLARFVARVDAGVGYRLLGMDFSSTGDGLANYAADATAAAGFIASDVTARRARLVFGFDGRVVGSRATPGLRYVGPTSPPGNIAFSTFDADVGARAGLRVRALFDVAVRVGAHYDAFVTKQVENAGTIPRERLLGATLGARVHVSPPASRVTAIVRFDVLVGGSRQQTSGLEDGTASTAHAWWGGVSARYRLASRFALHGGLELGRASTSWSGMSVRHPGATSARRVDTLQLLQLGVSVEL